MLEIPTALLKSLNGLKGFDEVAFIDAHREENKITSIRLNPFKPTAVFPDFELADNVKWARDAFYLDPRPSFILDPLFHAGCYYVQEAGSMFLEFVLKQVVDFSAELKVLDLCAAPGGKSTLINSLLNEQSLLVSNELIKNRADVLTQNLSKWGSHNTVVTNSDAKKFAALNGFFDVVVVDAPCSGSGLFRKQPEAINEWNEDNVNLCCGRQRTILSDVLPSLKENGLLVYCTCSYSVEENEDIVKWLIDDMQMEYLDLAVPQDWGIVDTKAGYRFYPHLTKSEGFFCAALKKRSPEQEAYMPKIKVNDEASKTERVLLEPFLKQHLSPIIKKNNQFHLMNEAALNFLMAYEKQFYFKKAGCVLGEIKGKDVVPNQELAWSDDRNININQIELNKEDAIKFLRKENFSITEKTKGFVLVIYKNYGLGWVKILPNRINNYLPNELRILR